MVKILVDLPEEQKRGTNFAVVVEELPEERLFDLCRWNRSNYVADFLSANPKLDIFCGDGKFFNLAISNKSLVMLKSLLEYCEHNKPNDQSSGLKDERLKFEYKLKSILQKSLERHNISHLVDWSGILVCGCDNSYILMMMKYSL